MSWESKPVVNIGPASVAPKATIRELISTLRSAFKPLEFDQVQQILLNREADVNRSLREMSVQVVNWKKECDLVEKKHREWTLTKLEMEGELKKYRIECDELREQVTRSKEDQRVYHDREIRAEERYAKTLEEFAKAEKDKKEMILQLNEEIMEMRSQKSKAEVALEAWKKKNIGELKQRVLRLEEDSRMLMSGEPLLQQKIEEESGAERPVSDELMGEKEASTDEKYQNELCVSTINANFVHLQTKESVSNFHEKIDISPGARSACNSPLTGSNGSRDAGPHSIDLACNNRRPVRKQSIFKADSSDKKMGSSMRAMAGSVRLGSKDVIEIGDSDDEMPIMTSQMFVKCAFSGQRGEKNGSSCVENSLLASMHKRKRASNHDTSECKNDDNDIPIGKRKTKHLQELIQEIKASPVNHCFAKPADLCGANVVKDVPPSVHNPVFIRQCGEKGEIKHNSQISSCSSDSDQSSDADGDSYMDRMIASLR